MNKKILLIDDSRTQLSTLKILYMRAGFDVITASDGIEGYQKIFETAPDIIISDIIMPNFTGYQFCRLVKDNPVTKDIPVILLTVLEQKIDKFWSKKSGADYFILKSDDVQKSIEVIKELINQHPISDETKKEILGQSFSSGAIQTALNHILDSALMQSSILNEFRLLTMHIQDNNALAKNLFDLLSSVLNHDLSLLLISPPGASEKEVYANSCNNIEETIIKQIVEKTVYKIFGENTHYNFKTTYGNLSAEEQINTDAFENMYVHPVKYNDEIVGVICFFGLKDKKVEAQKIFPVVLKEIELLIIIQALYAQNKYLSLTDSLTGLYNRRYLMETLGREYSRAKRYNAKLGIAMIDIDFFKKVNDTYGHQAGDFILKEVTQILKSMLRKSDILFRYGGEEVLAIMPETSKENSLVPIQRIREAIEQKDFIYQDQTIKITISVGLSDSFQQADSLEQFIEHADKAMYESKQNGRNQVTIYNE